MNNRKSFSPGGKPRSKLLILACLLLTALLFTACSSGGSSDSEKDLSVSDPANSAENSVELGLDQTSIDDQNSSSGITTSISDLNPCDLLTLSEVEGILGEPLSSSEQSDPSNFIGCNYRSQNPGKFIIVQVIQQTAERFRADNEATAAALETELVPVENLGDEAAFYGGLLRVRVGENVVQIATWHTESEMDQALEIAQELARIATSRLP